MSPFPHSARATHSARAKYRALDKHWALDRHPATLGPAAAGLTLLLAACGSPGTSTDAAAAGPPRPGGTLTLGIAYNPDCLDPQQGFTNAILNVGRQLVDSLTDQDPKTGQIKPWLAQSWEVNPDATSYTFHLRDGATFSDGSAVNAQAVKDNFDGIVKLGAKSPLGSGYLGGYRGTTALDEHTAKVDFSASSAQFLQASSTMSLGLLSPASLAKAPDQRCQGDGLIGSGPFVLDSVKPNQSVVISKRKGYNWGSSLWEHTGEAYLDKIDYRVTPEAGVRTGSLVSGQFDAITDVQPPDEKQFAGNGFTEPVRANPGVVFNLSPNVSRPILSEEPVRQAILKGVDRQEVVDTVLTPNYKAATSILATSTPDYTNLSGKLGYDAAGAQKLLDSDGWAPGPDGIRTKNGTRLSLNVVFASNFNPNQTALELIQQQLKKIGVDLRLKLVTAGELAQLQATGNYDFSWYNLTRADPDLLRTIFSTKYSDRSHITPGELDTLLDQQAATGDSASRAKIVEQVQNTVIDRAYVIPVFELTQVLALSSKVHGPVFEASSRLQFHDTWLSS